ncbi:DUF2339 domain-containing protein [Planktotalea sp.]|uniref:DUF2339 domain-containing protein n=1 Tax=Planktotalea sp. TaxID=2029877 RepID=UPI003299D0AE
MESLLILIAIIVVAGIVIAPIGVMVLSRKVRDLTDRVQQLERAGLGATPSRVETTSTSWTPPEELRAEGKSDVAEAPDDIESFATAAVATPDDVTTEDQTSGRPERAVVFRAETFAKAAAWIKDNWFLGIAAISLALAGIFTVQYGVEQGLLTPFARIMGALGLGAAFIILGEFLRRRFGDQSGTMTGLPSTFSGAGIVTLFAAVLSARHLYNMLPSDLALYALIAVAALAIVLGWFYGPFLAGVGVAGALVSPFIVGGSSDAPHLFYYYFALIMVMALAIDTVRRWAWVSVLALIGGFAATWMLLISGADSVHAMVFYIIATIAAVAIPQRRVWPDHQGATLSDLLLNLHKKGQAHWPDFPTRLASGTFVAALAFSAVLALDTTGSVEGWASIATLVLLGLLALIWMERAPALEDMSALAPLVLLGLLFFLAADRAPIFQDFSILPEAEDIVEQTMPRAASAFAAIFAVFAGLGFWRASKGVRGSLIWVGASALALPAAFGALEMFWTPSDIIGAYPWAGHVIAGAALMTLLTERAIKRWPNDLRPAALFAMSALSLIAFALMLILSAAALSVAIAVMIVIAALIDRRLDMPWLGLFIQLCVAVLAWRFIIDPGVPWASWQFTPFWEVVIGYTVPLAFMGLAWWILRPIKRVGAQLALESAIWTLGAVFMIILLERWLRSDIDSFWGISLAGSVALVSMGAQLYRWRSDAPFKALRVLLAALIGLIAFGTLFVGLVMISPLTRWGASDVEGRLLLDTIAIGYLVPAVIFTGLAWKLEHVANILRRVFMAASAMLVSAYIGFEIRRFWQGEAIANNTVSQGELYSYTIAMMIASVALLFFAFARRSDVLRKLAMAGIALTIAKVFLIDMSGLTGLVRVASFLGLGLALSALAWLSRAMTARWETEVADNSDT